MEDPRWLRLVTVGLVLAALAVGYFLLTGRFNLNNQTKPNNQVINQGSPTPSPIISETAVPGDGTVPNATPPAVGIGSSPVATPNPRSNVTILPRTGYHLIILGIISAGVMISGLGLRKYPH